MVKGGAADLAGVENEDILVEINGVNVENRSHDEVVEMIRHSGNSLNMLLASKSVYDQLNARGVNITSQLLAEKPEVQVQSMGTVQDKRHEDDSRPETPVEAARARVSDIVLHI